MHIVAHAQMPLATKDPREAVEAAINWVEAHAASLEGLGIDLDLMCMTNRQVIVQLAEQLPSKTLGFKNIPSDRELTSEEFQTSGAQGLCSFSGILTEHLLAADAFALVRQLLQSPAAAIRSTSFNVRVTNIHCTSTPAEAVMSVDLSDFKAFKRAQRFWLSFNVKLPGADPKSVEVRNSLKQISEATGIAFKPTKVSRVLGEKGRTPARARAVLIGQVCFEEAFENFASHIPKQWLSELAPNALPPDEAFEQRCQHWGSGSGGKVNLLPLLKRAVKQDLPEFRFERANADQILFAKPFGPDVEMLLLFAKGLYRIGKAFSLSLGVRNVAEQLPFTTNVFQLERTTESKMWIYNDRAEAAAAVSEAANLVKEVQPAFESSLRRYFEPWPTDFPASLEQHGPLTAREAFAKAAPLARSVFPDAELIRLANSPRSVAVRDIEGPELSLDGRLVPNALWSFHFYSAGADVSFAVTVPALGRMRMLHHGKPYQGENPRGQLVPVDGAWMDSNQAFALAEERGGRQRRSSGKTFGLLGKMQMSPSQRAYWAFMYLVVDERGRNDLIVNLDAVTGEPLNDVQGF